MHIVVKLFGPQAQLAGKAQIVLDWHDDKPTCAKLIDRLAELEPQLRASLPASRLAVNFAFGDADTVITADDEVALIGMVSGG